jgi:hypothetical protein
MAHQLTINTGAVMVLGLLVLAPDAPSIQRRSTQTLPAPSAAARRERPVPFQIGETLTYDVAWSSYLSAGTAVVNVKEKRPSFDSTAYYIVAEARPTPLLSRLYTLYYKLDTLIDAYTLLPQRGSVYTEEGNRHHLKTTRFDRRQQKAFFEYQSGNTINSEFAVPALTQDALSAIYAMRSIPLKAGDHMTMPVSDDGVTYRMAIDVAPPEPVKTPLGELNAWKILPIVTDDKGQTVFRNLAVWISDDARRYPLKIQAEVAVGTFTLLLSEAR